MKLLPATTAKLLSRRTPRPLFLDCHIVLRLSLVFIKKKWPPFVEDLVIYCKVLSRMLSDSQIESAKYPAKRPQAVFILKDHRLWFCFL